MKIIVEWSGRMEIINIIDGILNLTGIGLGDLIGLSMVVWVGKVSLFKV